VARVSAAVWMRYVAVVWCAACLIAGFRGCDAALRDLSRPRPLSVYSRPTRFYVIAVPREGSPVLLLHSISNVVQQLRTSLDSRAAIETELRRSETPVLWADDRPSSSRYSFYLDSRDIGHISRSVSDDRNLLTVRVRLENDNPEARSQRVLLDCTGDDFTYSSVYDVRGSALTPIAYGDLTKSDGWEAFLRGFRLPAPLIIAGCVLFVAARRRRHL